MKKNWFEVCLLACIAICLWVLHVTVDELSQHIQPRQYFLNRQGYLSLDHRQKVHRITGFTLHDCNLSLPDFEKDEEVLISWDTIRGTTERGDSK
jgi:hypothetical protein